MPGPLRIGVNALYLIPGGVGGTEIYLRGLLAALAEIDRVNHYFIFTNRETGEPPGPPLAPELPNFTHMPQALRAVSRPALMVWEQTALPLEAARLRLDVMLNPGFTAPILCPCEWLEFIQAGGYATPSLWLSDGWAVVQAEGWQAPGYWRLKDGSWHAMTLAGLKPVDPSVPVMHVSYYEADAFARFAGKHLPSEFEWEVAARENVIADAFGIAWQWTRSAYLPYPGYRAAEGALGEYNGKFIVNQMVLRGSSLATPEGHARPSYRNFFYPPARWQFTGLRLAEFK